MAGELRPRSIILPVIIAVFCAVGGWLFGSWSTCGKSCSFDVALFDAIGTWVGGIGGVSAAGIAAWLSYYIHKRDRGYRTEAEEKATQDAAKAALVAARRCVVRARPGKPKSGPWDRVFLTFTNPLDDPVTAVAIFYDGELVVQDSVVAPGRSWGGKKLFRDLDLAPIDDEQQVQEAVNANVLPKIVFEYVIGGHKFRRQGNEVTAVATTSNAGA